MIQPSFQIGRTVLSAVFAQAICAQIVLAQSPAPGPSPAPTSVRALFSPKGGCTTAVVEALRSAKAGVLVQAYGFTSRDIAFELVQTRRRGVPVRVILDGSNRTAKYSSANFLVNMGVPVWIDSKHAIAHDKVMVIDSALVITGSFNFTKAAEERNSENLLLVSDGAIASQYEKHWSEHLVHSDQFVGKAEAAEVSQGAEPQKARILAISTKTGDEKVVRWGYSADVMMQQIALSGETTVWVGDPDTDSSNSRMAVFAAPDPPIYSRGGRSNTLVKAAQVPPPDTHQLVILSKDNGPAYGDWVRRERFGYVIHAEGVRCHWYGCPDKLRHELVPKQGAATNSVPDAEAQE